MKLIQYRNNLICARSPDDHHQVLLGRIIAFENEQINTKPVNTRRKFVKVNSIDRFSFISKYVFI